MLRGILNARMFLIHWRLMSLLLPASLVFQTRTLNARGPEMFKPVHRAGHHDCVRRTSATEAKRARIESGQILLVIRLQLYGNVLSSSSEYAIGCRADRLGD